ncbi:unnamed protein product, partial [Ectocarpus sp. 12 AP-2014]
DGSNWGVKIAYSHEDEPLETAGGIIQALPLLGADPFVLVNADIYTDYDFAALIASAASLDIGAARLVLVDNPGHNLDGDFSLNGDRVVDKQQQSLTYAGIGLYHPAFFAGCDAGKRPMLPLLNKAIAEQRLRGEHHRGFWTDVGTPERLATLNEQA